MRDDNSEGLNARASHLVELAREELGQMSARRRAEGLARLNARRAPGRRRQRLLLGLAAVLAAVTLVVVGRHSLGLHRAEVLSYGVEGGQVDATGNVAAQGKADPALRFSDGTEVVFFAGARGRVHSVSEHGARIAVTGKVRVGVVPWPGARWLFDAGPFLITVKGTAFTAEWRDAEGQLEIVLETGTVAVSGPLADEAITLRAGQRLVISTRRKEVLILNMGTSTATGATTSVSPSPSSSDAFANAPSPESRQPPAERSAQPLAPAPASPTAAAPSATASDWTAALAAGDFATILREAEQRGLDASIAQVSSGELAALADAARYSRREDVARRALAAQRRRFPHSRGANDAAFLLGRLEETAQHAELALTWYERCLTESPQGAYVSEALGRKMTIVQRLHGATQARPIAAEYLRRFGNGTYAAAARALTGAP